MRQFWSLFLTLFVWTAVLSTTACYRTHIDTRATPLPDEYQDRQAFALWGLMPLEAPAGAECAHGVAKSSSRLSVVDVLIDVGVGALAGGVVLGTCQGDSATCASRASSAATLATGLFSTRTVTYQCAAPSAGATVAPTSSTSSAPTSAP